MSDSIGGRIDMTCPSCTAMNVTDCTYYEEDCVCHEMGEFCYSQYLEAYDVFLVLILLTQLWNFYHGAWHTFEIINLKVDTFCPSLKNCIPFRGESNSMDSRPTTLRRPVSSRPGQALKRLSAMESIIVLTTGGVFVRLVWLVVVINGRTKYSMLVSPAIESILLKTPQIFWIAGFFYTALVWERLSGQASNMAASKGTSKKWYTKLSFKVNALNMFLLFIMLPAYIYGNLAMPVIVNLVDYFLMLLCLFVSISGIRFGNKLCKELESSMMSKQLIPTIKGVVFQGNVAAWTVILWGVGYNVAGRYLGNKWLALAYSGTVHIFCEPLICLALLKTKKDTAAKKAAEQRKLREESKSGVSMSIRSRLGTATSYSEANSTNVTRPVSAARNPGGNHKNMLGQVSGGGTRVSFSTGGGGKPTLSAMSAGSQRRMSAKELEKDAKRAELEKVHKTGDVTTQAMI